jgi:hypothetical protein
MTYLLNPCPIAASSFSGMKSVKWITRHVYVHVPDLYMKTYMYMSTDI